MGTLKKNLPIIFYIISILQLIIVGSYFFAVGLLTTITTDFLLNAIYNILLSIVFALFITNIISNYIIPKNIEQEIGERFDNIQKNINLADAGIVDFAKGESREEKYEKIASEATKEILVCGIGFSLFIQDFDKIERLINKVDNFKILMLNPEIFTNTNMERYIKKVSSKVSVKSDV